jgi:hypothetical protein
MVDYEKLGVFYLGREVDRATGQPTPQPILYDSKDLTTHAVCVGMTGSGKTGLCLALLEEAAIDGVPALCIDPKGDLGNLLLAFPSLAPQDFAPWIDPAEAARKGLAVDAFAAKTAETWRNGLAEWDQAPERIAKFRDAVDVAVYTPGAETGLPLSVLRSFGAPPAETLTDATSLRERVNAVVSGLFALLGREVDPLQSREHILLANIVERAWRAGTSLDIAGLVAAVQRPAFETVGALDLETFFPAKDRLQLAMALNILIASPGFAAWMNGEPLDAQRLLFTPEGKPRISIVSIAHLGDAERMFIVTLLLNEVIAWMRAQPGTSSLRAILYMDEIFGYFPPSANPPSKVPMLTLLKQARAYGLGCVLATQNPVDLDYKGLSNAGTWWIGRLQTERDKLRLIEGLESALSGAALDRATLDALMSSLTQRVFLMRNVHDDAPALMKTRWALSYLRGPMTGSEVARAMAPWKAAAPAGAPVAAIAAARTAGDSTSVTAAERDPSRAAPRPALPAEVTEYFAPATGGTGPLFYKPMIVGFAKLHFVDAKLALDQWQTAGRVAPLADDGKQALWNEAAQHSDLKARLTASPQGEAEFAPLPAAALRTASYEAWGKALAGHLYESARSEVFVCDALGATSSPGESEGDFRSRLALRSRERRDADVGKLRAKYAPKLAGLQDQLRRAQEREEREKSQLSQAKLQTALSIGSTVLGALLGRRAISATSVGRAASAARSAGRIGSQSDDVGRAAESRTVIEQRLTALQQEWDAETAHLGAALDPATVMLRRVSVAPRKSDIAIGEIALLWVPWRKGADGFPAPAFA